MTADSWLTDDITSIRYADADEEANLYQQHRRMLIESGIDPEVARERGYRSVSGIGVRDELARFDFSTSQIQRLGQDGGLLVPVHTVEGRVGLVQYRPDRASRRGKYETPTGHRLRIDVPPRARPDLRNPNVPLWVTEGAKKADSAVTQGLCCIALLGVFGWRATNEDGGTTALGDWESIALNGRRVYLAFDSDAMVKRQVHGALARLSELLASRGAEVLFVYLPSGPHGEKQGLDDYFGGGGTVQKLVRDHVTDELRAPAQVDEPEVADEKVTEAQALSRVMAGDAFVLDEPDHVVAVWGDGDRVLHAEGEGLVVVGQQGVGKTTLIQQMTLHRMGIRTGPLLGLTVAHSDRSVLYLAMDRPRQAARSYKRMVSDEDRELLRDRLLVWTGPLPMDPTRSPQALADFVQEIGQKHGHDIGLVVVDSMKDLAPGISKDEVGAALNSGFQELIARDVQFIALHHERKASQGTKRLHSLDDVYGSVWLTAGMGSVTALEGDPGDPNVTLTHLKQPAEPVGPLDLRHNHAIGTTLLFTAPDYLEVIRRAGQQGVTVEQVAQAVIGRCLDADKQNARRQLNKLVKAETVEVLKGSNTASGREPARYRMSSAGLWVDGIEDLS